MKINREEKVVPIDSTTFKSGALDGMKILATGTLKHFSRKGIEETVQFLGGSFASAVTNSLDFLICGDNAGGKLQKAKDLGLKIIDEDEFISIITKSNGSESSDESKIDIYIHGYGCIFEYKLLNDNDLKNFRMALKYLKDFDPGFFPLDLEDVYDDLKGNDFEISKEYFESYMSSVFQPGFNEITIVDSIDKENEVVIDGDVDETYYDNELVTIYSNLVKDEIIKNSELEKYSNIVVIGTTGLISDFEEGVTIKNPIDFEELTSEDIEFTKIREITILGQRIPLSGDNWDLEDGEITFVIAMPIKGFLNLKNDNEFDLEKYKIL